MIAPQRILLVDDDAVSLKLMRDVLHAHGYETIECGDGHTAVALAGSSSVRLVVMDIGLPGMDGAEAARRLRRDERTRALPLIAVTAYAMPADERRMREAGCDAFLTKPLKLSDFVQIVEGVLADVHDRRPAS